MCVALGPRGALDIDAILLCTGNNSSLLFLVSRILGSGLLGSPASSEAASRQSPEGARIAYMQVALTCTVGPHHAGGVFLAPLHR